MRVSARTIFRLRLANTGSVLLFVLVVGLLMALSRAYHVQFDWTGSKRNTLSPASTEIVQRLEGPVRITAFARDNRDLRGRIEDLVSRYQRVREDLTLGFVDPDREPGRTRETGIKFDGELLVEYAGRRETVRRHTEEDLTNALARLMRGRSQAVAVLQGHGERSPDANGDDDISTLATRLRNRGVRMTTLNLGAGKGIPEDTAAVVIASPRSDLLEGEVEVVRKFVESGGNLLWLQEPGPLNGLEPLAEFLGVDFEPGTIVDTASQALGLPPTVAVVSAYGSHPVVKDFAQLTVFPEARSVRAEGAQNVLETLPSAWVETGELSGQVAFDEGVDRSGPVAIGVAITRENNGVTQRIMVIGDGDFLSNHAIGSAGNLDLATNLVNWLARDDTQINVPARGTPDLALNLGATAQITLAAVLLAGMPLLLLGTGTVVWLRRRRR